MSTTPTLPTRPEVGQILLLASTVVREFSREAGLRLPVTNYEVIVTRIGSRWCYFRHVGAQHGRERRFDLTDPRWRVDEEYAFDLRVWPSREAWLAWLRRESVLREFRRLADWGELAPHVTEDDVREAARRLGLLEKLDAAIEGKP